MTGGDETGKNRKKTDPRAERLAAALRANLRRRKAQERGRGVQNKPGNNDKG